MEKYSHYLMWEKSKKNSFMNPFNESWEEEAFAHNGDGLFGSFIWPPRSYSCSFCKKEFRSAQALGGHMNIHRRERAKLKQSLNYTTPPQNPKLHKNLPNPSFESLPRVSLSQTTLSSFDDHGVVETNLILGFHLDASSSFSNSIDERCFDEEVKTCKRQKTTVLPLIIGSIEEVDLELRLAT